MMLLRCLTSSESDDGSCECSATLTKQLPLGTLNPHTWARGTGLKETEAERTWWVVEAGAVDSDAERGTAITIGDLGWFFFIRRLIAAGG
jgi:hypothetical protein